MTTLKETAMAYVPPQKHNIADLKRISVDVDLKDGDGKDRDGTPYTYKYILVDGEEYRVAGPVIKGIKNIIEKFPNCKFVSVMKDGVGLETRYQVVPLLEQTPQ